MKIPVVTAEEVATWPASKINSMLDRLRRLDSKLTDQFITAGRGHETASEIHMKSDPLAQEARKIFQARMVLDVEIYRRYGPGAPSRLPSRGFGPRS